VRNIDGNFGRAACEACSVGWNLVTNLSFPGGRSKIMENLDRVGKMFEIPVNIDQKAAP
jgi:hypothetical protein